MQNVIVERQDINVEALDGELRAALGALVYGISLSRGEVVVHLDSAATAADEAQAEQIVVDHDETQLTAEQQAQADLEAERDSYASPLDPQAVTLQDLAARKRNSALCGGYSSWLIHNATIATTRSAS